MKTSEGNGEAVRERSGANHQLIFLRGEESERFSFKTSIPPLRDILPRPKSDLPFFPQRQRRLRPSAMNRSNSSNSLAAAPAATATPRPSGRSTLPGCQGAGRSRSWRRCQAAPQVSAKTCAKMVLLNLRKPAATTHTLPSLSL